MNKIKACVVYEATTGKYEIVDYMTKHDFIEGVYEQDYCYRIFIKEIEVESENVTISDPARLNKYLQRKKVAA